MPKNLGEGRNTQAGKRDMTRPESCLGDRGIKGGGIKAEQGSEVMQQVTGLSSLTYHLSQRVPFSM